MAGSTTSKTLRIVLEATGAAAAARQIAAVDKAVGNLGKQHPTLSKFGAGLGNVVRNSLVLGTVAAGAVGGYLALSIKNGQEATRVQQIFNTAVANSGKVSAAQVTALNAQQQALMNLAGVDDELIAAEQTKLIQMGATGAQTQALTPLILDLSKATGMDLITATTAVGKALNGNAGGLQRLGVFVDKTAFKTNRYAAIQEALTKKYGGTTQALSGNFDTRMAALRANLDNISESVGQKMLPALTRIVDVVGAKVVPAFGKLVDRVMPGITAAIGDFATMLENGGAERAIDAIYTSVSALVDLLRIAAEPVKAIVGAFMALPKEVQTVLVAGFAVNKLSGGMFGSIVGDLAGNALKGILNVTAASATVNAGVVTVSGPTAAGLPTGGGPTVPTPTGGGGGPLGAIKNAVRGAAVVAGAGVALETAIAINEARSSMAPDLRVLGPRLAVTQPGWNQSLAANRTGGVSGGARDYYRGAGVNIAPLTAAVHGTTAAVNGLRNAMRVNVNVKVAVSDVQRAATVRAAVLRGGLPNVGALK